MLAKSKLNSLETLVSQALIDLERSHQEFVTLLKERAKYEKMKTNVRNASKNIRPNRANSKNVTSL